MATFHVQVKTGGKGRAQEHGAYIAREGRHRARGDLIDAGYGNLPSWAGDDPSQLWRGADRFERENGSAYREVIVALPNELFGEQLRNLVADLIKLLAGTRPYQYAVHCPRASLDGRVNTHLHLMVSDRLPDGIERPASQMFRRFNGVKPEAGGCRKDGGGMTRATLADRLVALRANVAGVLNYHLERGGFEGRVDHRSLQEQGVPRWAERHLGPARIRRMSPDERSAYVDTRYYSERNGRL